MNNVIDIVALNGGSGLLLSACKVFARHIALTVREHHCVIYCFIILVFCYFALLKHIVKTDLLTFFVFFGVNKRIIFCRRLSYCRQRRTFSKIKVLHIFSEILFGGGLYAITAVAHIDRIHIRLKYCLLRGIFLKVQCRQYFIKFTIYGFAVFSRKIFNKLLSKG